MSQKRTVEIMIAQQKLSLLTDEDPAHVQKTADLINKRLNALLVKGQPLSHQVLMLLAMNLGNDLIKMKDESRKFKDQVRARSEAILTRLDKEFSI